MSDDFEHEVLAAADQALCRVLSGVADRVESMPPELEPVDALRWAGDRATELLAGFAELPLDRLLGLGGPADGTPARTPTPVGDPLTVRASAGSTVEARVWVHLMGGSVAGALRFSLGALTGPDGVSWQGADPVFRPVECVLPISAPWSTVLRFGIPLTTSPGTHHGVVVGSGAASPAVPITVVIT